MLLLAEGGNEANVVIEVLLDEFHCDEQPTNGSKIAITSAMCFGFIVDSLALGGMYVFITDGQADASAWSPIPAPIYVVQVPVNQ